MKIIQVWPSCSLYVINEQHGKSISQVWDGNELMLMFRRNISEALIMTLWWDLCSVIDEGTIVNNDDD